LPTGDAKEVIDLALVIFLPFQCRDDLLPENFAVTAAQSMQLHAEVASVIAAPAAASFCGMKPPSSSQGSSAA
jgi:hypothetical protein